MTDVLVTGGEGVVGSQVVRSLYDSKEEVAYTCFSEEKSEEVAECVDIRDPVAVSEVVERRKPSTIIHTAAITDVDMCETNNQLAYETNVTGTKNVVEAAEDVGARIMFFSSSFVFSGQEQQHEEADVTDPINYYGETKEEAENIVLSSNMPATVIRTDQPYGWTTKKQHNTMVEWVLNRLREDATIEVFTDWYNNPILVKDLVTATISLNKQQSTGIYHVSGPEYLSRWEWAKKIANTFDYESDAVQGTQSSQHNLPAKRPNVKMSNKKIVSETDIRIRSVEEGLKYMKNNSLAEGE